MINLLDLRLALIVPTYNDKGRNLWIDYRSYNEELECHEKS